MNTSQLESENRRLAAELATARRSATAKIAHRDATIRRLNGELYAALADGHALRTAAVQAENQRVLERRALAAVAEHWEPRARKLEQELRILKAFFAPPADR